MVINNNCYVHKIYNKFNISQKIKHYFFSALKFNCRYYQTIHKKKVMCFINSFKPTHWLIKYNQTLINLPIAITEL